ncbi:MAG TPA: pyridoxine 5'-phosphate synthase [Burkholderiales bacterium]|nr:pyridoxine 5'-phosphate synthase [Burkholderiales bacterium]
MTRLSVNLNKVALLRNSRTLGIPSVTRAAVIALDTGARGITVHPRPDGRHIRTEDVYALVEVLKRYPDAEFNIEGNPFHAVLDIVRSVKPHQFTLVPDEPAAYTSDHGWDLQRDGVRLAPIVAELKRIGVRVSLFMDPEPAAMPLARTLGADRVELYTEPYAASYGKANEATTVMRYAAAAEAARRAGLGLNAGHDLNQQNLARLITAIPDISEVSIGHALIAEALEDGLATTVRNYVRILDEAARGKRTA